MELHEPPTGHRPFMPLRYEPFAHLLLIILVGLIAYSNTFNASFHFDDTRNIVANSLIRDFANFFEPSRAKDHPYYFDFKMRIIGFLSFALDYKLHGLRVTGFHVLNLLVHVLNGFLVYAFVMTLFNAPKMRHEASDGAADAARPQDHRTLIALFSALLFVSHPIQTQAVTYIVQRFASLCTTFYLMALLAYARSRLLQMQRCPAPAGILYVVSLMSTILAMKTKEIAFTIPIVISLFELLFFDRPSISPKRRLALLLPFVLTFAVIPLSAIDMEPQTRSAIDQLTDKSKVLTTLSRTDYFLTQLTVVPVYMRLILLPVGQSLDYDHPIYTTLLNARVLLSAILLLLVLLIGVWSLLVSSSQDSRYRLVSFGIFWFYLTLLPESSIIPIVDVIFEHRAYLPSVGAFIAIASAALILDEALQEKYPGARRVLPIICSGLVLIFTATTYARNGVWKDEVTLWEDVVSKHPGKDRARNTLGSLYLDAGQLQRAHDELRRTLEINPRYWAARVNLGTCRMRMALAAYDEARSSERALDLIGEAIASFEQALALDPGNAMIASLLSSAREHQSSLRMAQKKKDAQ